MTNRIVCAIVASVAAAAAAALAQPRPDEELRQAVAGKSGAMPVDADKLLAGKAVPYYAIRNLLPLGTVHGAVRGGDGGLTVDLTGVGRLLDGTKVDPADIHGTACYGPYPFEAAETTYPYKRFRLKARIARGRAKLDLDELFQPKKNSEGWQRGGTVCVRLDLHLAREGADRPLGVYDTFASFARGEEGYAKLPSLVEGPHVHLAGSEDPSRAVISFELDTPAAVAVVLGDGRTVAGDPDARRQEIALPDLPADAAVTYRLRIAGRLTTPRTVRTPPTSAEATVTFAYCGDSREGVGGGMQTYMGINYTTLERTAALAAARGARFWVMGGDLINGYTTSREDFRGQLYAWKQAMTGFWATRPVLVGMGNHEALLATFMVADRKNRIRPVGVDRWPYATHSAEAVFARAFVNPADAPDPADPRRPPYAENVYTFRYGPVMVLCFNNNYWYTNAAELVGGSPEGYIFDDQLDWIEARLDAAAADPNVRHVFLFAQEPVLPCGGHVKDAMWYHGDNTVRAVVHRDGRLVPEKNGILEVRNRLIRAASKCGKVVAILGSDEHAYYRLLVDAQVPLGEPSRDDRDGDGRIDWTGDEPARPLELPTPLWFITSGGGGAPYYAEEPTPWNTYWHKTDAGPAAYLYSSQENVVLFHAGPDGVGLEVLNPRGEVIDRVKDLTAARHLKR